MKKIIKFIIFIISLVCLILLIVYINKSKPEKDTIKIKVEKHKIENLIIEIPADFKLDSTDEENHIVYYNYNDKELENTCIVMIGYKDKYTDDMEKEAKDNIFVTGSYNVEVKNINNQAWTLVSLKHNVKTLYYSYATSYKDKIYNVKYEDLGIGDYCDTVYKKIFKTIKFEE